MEGYIGEIRGFAADFAPKGWAYCNGNTLNISTNQALFSILGTYYGGNGSTTFQLPNLNGTIAVGTGTYDSQSFNLGQVGGEENHTLTLGEIPTHNHGLSIVAGTSGTITCTLNGSTAAATLTDGTGALYGSDDGSSPSLYAAAASSPNLVNLATDSVSITAITPGTPTVSLSNSGASQGHSNMQPVQSIHYIICLYGIYPSRN